MSMRFPVGAQHPELPHPGEIEFRYSWNNTTEIHDASNYSDDVVFRCYDANGQPAPRARAAWCIPVVEVVIRSLDKNGELVDPKDAKYISSVFKRPGRVPFEHARASRK